MQNSSPLLEEDGLFHSDDCFETSDDEEYNDAYVATEDGDYDQLVDVFDTASHFEVDKKIKGDTLIFLAFKIINRIFEVYATFEPSTLAKARPYIKIVEFLLKKGASVSIKNEDGYSCLSLIEDRKDDEYQPETLKELDDKIKHQDYILSTRHELSSIVDKIYRKINPDESSSPYPYAPHADIQCFARDIIKFLMTGESEETLDELTQRCTTILDDIKVKPYINTLHIAFCITVASLIKAESSQFSYAYDRKGQTIDFDDEYYYTYLSSENKFYRLTPASYGDPTNYLITTIVYEAMCHGCDADIVKLHHKIICKIKDKSEDYDEEEYKLELLNIETTDNYYGENISDNSDSEDEEDFKLLPMREQRLNHHYAKGLFNRSQSEKLFTQKGKMRECKEGLLSGYQVDERQSIWRELPLSNPVLRDLARLNQLALTQALNEETIATIATKFCIASYRGIAYRTDEFSTSARRMHRGINEVKQPLFSKAVLKLAGYENSTQYFEALYVNPSLKEKMLDLAASFQEKLVQLKNSGPVKLNLLGSYYNYDNALHAIQDVFTKDYDKFHDILRSFVEEFIDKPSETLHIPLKTLKDAIVLSICAPYSPFVSTSDTPMHALRYAYGHKYYPSYKERRLRPRWRNNGEVERPYSGKVYIILCDPVTLIRTSHHLPSLDQQGEVYIDKQTIAEREMSFFSHIPDDQVVSQQLAKFPAFKSEYKQRYLQKYGLTPDLYKHFQKAIQESKPHSTTRKNAKNLLTNHLISFHEVCLIEEARVAAEMQGAVLIYRDEHGGFSQIPCQPTPPAKAKGAIAQAAVTAQQKRLNSKRLERSSTSSSKTADLPITEYGREVGDSTVSSKGFLEGLFETFEIYPTREMTQSLPDALCFLLGKLEGPKFETLDCDLTELIWRQGDTHDSYFNRVKAFLLDTIQRYEINIRLHSPMYDGNCYDFGHTHSKKIDLYDLGGGCFAPLHNKDNKEPSQNRESRTASSSSACYSSSMDPLRTRGLFSTSSSGTSKSSTSSSTPAIKRQKHQRFAEQTNALPMPALLERSATGNAFLFKSSKGMASPSSATWEPSEHLRITRDSDMRGKVIYTFHMLGLEASLGQSQQGALRAAIQTAFPRQRGYTESAGVIIKLVLEDEAVAKTLILELSTLVGLTPDSEILIPYGAKFTA